MGCILGRDLYAPPAFRIFDSFPDCPFVPKSKYFKKTENEVTLIPAGRQGDSAESPRRIALYLGSPSRPAA